MEYAASPVFSGVVRSDDGSGVADVEVTLMQLQDGVWRRVGSATSDDDGAVSVQAPPVYENSAVRLRTRSLRSDRWRVTMHPELTLAPSVSGDTVTLVASALGGQQGDVVRLSGRRDGQQVTLATGILSADGTVTFQVQQKTKKSRYIGLLEASDEHSADKNAVVVVKPKAPKSGEG